MSARLLSGIVSSLYWIGLYVKPVEGDRDDPAVVKSRVMRIAASTTVALAVGPFVAQRYLGGTYGENFELQGLDINLPGTLKGLGLTMVLFMGPMLYNDLTHPDPGSWLDLRDFLFGPITEELVYRSVIIAFYKRASLSTSQIIWETPLYFGLAHLHHAVVRYRSGISFKECAIPALAHFLMTTVFGAYAAKLFVTYNSVWPSIAAHIFCNLMGPPDFQGPRWYQALLVVGLAAFSYGLYKI